MIGIFASPSQGTPLINSTYGANTTQENLTVYPQSVVCEGTCKNITDWRLWNGSDNNSIAVLNMPFEGGSSSDNQTNVADYSSYVNNGTNFHNVTYNATGGYDGKGAFEFDGEDDCVNMGNPADGSLDFGTNDFSVVAWINPKNLTAANGIIIGKQLAGGANVNEWGIQTTAVTSGKLRFTVSDGDGGDPYIESNSALQINQWQHVVGVRDGVNYYLYINGVLQTDTTSTANDSVSNSVDCYIGTLLSTGFWVFNGTIDDILIFNRSLSADQILAIYNNRTDLISSDETSIGDEWISCITPNNATGDGTTDCSENITILAATNPSVSNLIPATGTNFSASTTIEVAADVTDDAEVQSVSANITLPNSTIDVVSLTLATGNKYNNSYNILSVDGAYTFTIIAQDVHGNLNESESTTFNVDATDPTINLVSPDNYTWTTDLTPTFQFNFTDNLAPNASCQILVDGSAEATNLTVLNDTLTSLTPGSALSLGTHTWGVNCTDYYNNYNLSVNYTLDIVEKPTLTAPDNNSLQGNPVINFTSFTFNFTSNMIAGAGTNSASCELFIINSTGDIANGINTTTLNGTETIILNNQTLTLGSPTWFINCTYNNSIISSDTYTLNVDSETPTINLVTPTNNSWTSETKAGNVSFNFNFTAGNTNQASCELFITNASGTEIANGLNSTTLNNTATTITNNNSLLSSLNPNGVKANWTINCTFNGTTITAADYFSLNVDNVTPALTVSSSDVSTTTATLTTTTSEAATCKYSTSDIGYADMTGFGTTGGVTSHTTSLVSLSSGTSHTYYVKCQDSVPNTGSGSTSFTTTSVSGGSGSSGAGGGTSTGVTGQFEKKVWASINKGETATMPIKNGIIGITEIEFKAKDTMRGAWVNVEKIDTMPKTVKTIPRRVYSNIKITENNVQKYLEDKAKIKFKVLKSWLEENQLSSDNVALYRYKDDKWYELKTAACEEDKTYAYYSAETEGFSYFVIGEKEAFAPVEVTEETAEVIELPKEIEEITEEKKPFIPWEKINWLWLVPILTALVGIIFITYLLLKKKKK